MTIQKAYHAVSNDSIVLIQVHTLVLSEIYHLILTDFVRINTYTVFPVIPSNYSFFKIPSFDTVIINYGGRVKQKISQESDPIWSFKAKFSVLTQAEMTEILDFFIARKGSFESFYIYDELDTAYIVSFKEDILNIEYFCYQLYDLGTIEFEQELE